MTQLNSLAMVASMKPGSLCLSSETVSLLHIAWLFIDDSGLWKSSGKIETDIFAQASTILWKTVAHHIKRCLPVLVNVCSCCHPMSHVARKLILNALLTPISRGWNSLTNSPGMMASSVLFFFHYSLTIAVRVV